MCARRRWFQGLLGLDSYRKAGPRRIVALHGPRPARLALESLEDRTLLAASALQFASTYFSGAEGAGPAQVTVTRTGDTTGPATVKYATGNGTATAGTDYTTTAGTLAFAAGDASKTFTVPILDSTVLDGDKTVKLTLTTPTGASLGGPSVAVLTVADKQGTTHTQQYVFQLYKDLLNRLPDDAGVFHFSTEIDQGLASRTQAALEIINSPEYRNDVVANIYQQYLHRAPQAVEAGFWVNSLAQGGTIEQVRANVLGSPEYYTKRGAGTNNGFLKALYPDVLGRPLDAAGQAFFGQQFQQGTTPVAAAVLATPEYLQDVVQGYFQLFLLHPADAGALGYYVPQLQQGQRDEQVLAAVVSSEEYFGFDQAFISQVYLDLLNRTPDTTGMNYWAGFLGGASRTQLVQSIQSSQEYQTDVVQKLYDDRLGRDATAQELPFWQNYLSQGGSAPGVEAQVLGSAEFFARAGGNDDAFVQAVYVDGLNRFPDANGAASWRQALLSGTGRTTVAAAILDSTEATTDRVQNFFGALLKRTADDNAVNYFVPLLQSGATVETAMAQAAGSPEYYNQTGHSQFQLFTGPNDPLLLTAPAPDGGLLEYLGTKDATGHATGLTSVISVAPNGHTTFISVDGQGRPVQFLGSDGGVITVSWTTDSSLQVTATSADGSVQATGSLDLLAQPAPPAPTVALSSGAPPAFAPPGGPGPSAAVNPVVLAALSGASGPAVKLPANQLNIFKHNPTPTEQPETADPCAFLDPYMEKVCSADKIANVGLKGLEKILTKQAHDQHGPLAERVIKDVMETNLNDVNRAQRFCDYLTVQSAIQRHGAAGGLMAFLCLTKDQIKDYIKEKDLGITLEQLLGGKKETVSKPSTWRSGQPFSDFKVDATHPFVFFPSLIQLSTTQVSLSLPEGGTTGSASVTIGNAPISGYTNGTLTYSVTIDYNDCPGAWVTLPAGFTNRNLAVGASDALTISLNTTGLKPGTCDATVTVSDASGSRVPQTIFVTLTVTPVPPVSLAGTWSGTYNLTTVGTTTCPGMTATASGSLALSIVGVNSDNTLVAGATMTGIVVFHEDFATGACSTSTTSGTDSAVSATVTHSDVGTDLLGTFNFDTSFGTFTIRWQMHQSGSTLNGTFLKSSDNSPNGTIALKKS